MFWPRGGMFRPDEANVCVDHRDFWVIHGQFGP
jgi:hypothetical protein